jgi:hypothetical protein
MGCSKNLAIEKGHFDEPEDDSCSLDDFLCQIQAEELPYRRGFSSQPEPCEKNNLIEELSF